MDYSVIIVGGGPAGLSAALYTARAGLSTAVLSASPGALARAEKIENYFGISCSGPELLNRGRRQAEAAGVTFIEGEVLLTEPAEQGFRTVYSVKTPAAAGFSGTPDANGTPAAGAEYTPEAGCECEKELLSGAVILATGAQRRQLNLKNAAELEGRGVSYCAVCDAFFYRGADVAVLGAGEYALHELEALLPVVGSCCLLTDGEPVPAALPPGVKCFTSPLAALSGQTELQGVLLKDDTHLAVSGLFVAKGVAGAAELARRAGAETVQGNIIINTEGMTSLPGLFAAGDCTGGVLQVSVAVGEGAKAALSAIKYLKKTR